MTHGVDRGIAFALNHQVLYFTLNYFSISLLSPDDVHFAYRWRLCKELSVASIYYRFTGHNISCTALIYITVIGPARKQ